MDSITNKYLNYSLIRRKAILIFSILTFFIVHFESFGQVSTLYSETFATNGKGIDGVTTDMTGVTNWTIGYSGSWSPMAAGEYFKVVGGAFESFNTDATGNTPTNPTVSNFSTYCVVWSSLTVDISCYSNVSFSVDLGRASNNSGSGCKAYYTLNGGTTWVEFGSVVNTTGCLDNAFSTFTASGLTGTSAQIKVAHWGTSSTPKYRHDNVKIMGIFNPATSATNIALTNYTGSSIDLSWTNGSGNSVLVIAKPTSGTLVDPTSGVAYSASNVYGSGSQIGVGNYVVYNGIGSSVSISGLTNGIDYDFAIYTYNSGVLCYNSNELLGSTLCTPPATQASASSISAITTSGMNVSWINGNGDKTLVVVRANGATQTDPISNTLYSANSIFGIGSQIGVGNYVVYNGVGSSVAVSGLSPNTNYVFSIYTFNSVTNCYNVSELVGSATTLNTSSYEIDAFNGSTIVTCSGTFTDSNPAGNYSANEDNSITFCSGNGQLLKFTFSLGKIAPGDTLYLYDGTSTSAPLIQKLTGDASNQNLLPYFKESSSFTFLTPSSCITFQFKSNADATLALGWLANISCVDPLNCSSNPDASDLFGGAPYVCNLNGYCGKTSADFNRDYPVDLNQLGGSCPSSLNFLGTIENNSWIKFIADSTAVTFDFNVPLSSDCINGIQTAIFSYNGTSLTRMSPCALSDGSHSGNFQLTGAGLVVGQTYYIMTDGNAGDICDYTITANSGISIVSAGPDQNICLTNTTLDGMSVGLGSWSVIAGSGTFANATSPTTAVSGMTIGVNTFRWTSSVSCDNAFDDVTITVSSCACPTATIDYVDPFCKNISSLQAVTLSGTGTYTGGTYTLSPSGLTINSSTGEISPSTSTPGTYTVTYTILPSGGCVSTVTATTSVTINPIATSTTNTTICQNTLPYIWNGLTFATAGSQTKTLVSYLGCDSLATLNLTVNPIVTPTFSFVNSYCLGAIPILLPSTSDNGIPGTWNPATISTVSIGSINYVFSPDATQCATSLTVPVSVTQPVQPTIACYETATWNTATCVWDITGNQPIQPTIACYETATWNATTCVWDITGTQPVQPTIACYETATWNTATCVWDVTGTQPVQPAIACYETATWNAVTCVWDITGTQPVQPAISCYETATWNSVTCIWDITGTQPIQPTIACYETATWNAATCIWDVTGTQPVQPTIACYETAAWNPVTCVWDITGTQPVQPAIACYETATWNAGTCAWDISGTQPVQPTIACYETATWNSGTCTWDITGNQPIQPTIACYETATWNAATCVWDITGTQPIQPAIACYETATWNSVICVWDITGNQPIQPTIACYETATWNAATCVWDITGTQPVQPTIACYETATWNALTCVWDISGTQPAQPTIACYEIATWNAATCVWDISGTQPVQPAIACYETATWNATSCVWDITGTQPVQPAISCYETATWNTATCVWDVTGTQPVQPTIACYETATWNAATCVWDITGTQPVQPTIACYEIATWNATTCVWDVTGTQPAQPTIACYETATWNAATCTWDITGTQPVQPTISCYETATWNAATCVWDITGTQPVQPAIACYETATWNTATCVWDVTGTQPVQPTIACYETATWNAATCVWDITGTQPVQPAIACYETATWNAATCVWDVTGTQPVQPAIACYETATWNALTCVWDVTGTQPVQPAIACYETATWNSATCVWDITGTQPIQPTIACYETATWNSGTCTWDITGNQPIQPTIACYETATWNAATCVWDITGTQPIQPTIACYETATWNATTCVWDVTGTQPVQPTIACYETATWNTATCVWDITGTQPVQPTIACYETATWNVATCTWDVTGTQPNQPTIACYETATWNAATCVWDITGTLPVQPTIACYETSTWNAVTCVWDITGTQPVQPTIACYETATWNATTCVWDITGTQPIQPTIACYETATWNAATCVWDITGTQPVQPTIACYETATWNAATCVWDIAGTQPIQPTIACYQTATWNAATCVWDVTGTQPVQPAIACYETATWNAATCIWDVTGTQPVQPTIACYETATWNPVTCVWDVTGTQPVQPTISCYETATWNAATCVWDITGTQPVQPAIACYETATWNTATCVWDVTGTQPVQPTIACYETATWNAATCVWDITGTQPAQPTIACYETATWNAATCVWDVTGTQPVQPAIACYETATWNAATCVWDVTGTQPVQPAIACYETAIWNAATCVWDVTGTQPVQPTIACYETATWNTATCTWDVTGTQPVQPAISCYETATWNVATCIWDVTGTQPVQPAIACYETATWNATTCVWDITGTQPAQPTIACYETATWNAATCVWDVTGTQPVQPAIACYETAIWNAATCVWDVTGTQPVQPTIACYETATWNTATCTWDVTGTQPVQPAISCYETATWNVATCIWDVTGTQPVQPSIACYETATWNAATCVWDITGTQPVQPAIACYETATWNTATCVWDVTGQPILPATNPNNPTICSGDAIPALTVASLGAGYQLNWYNSAVGGVLLSQNSNSYTPTNSQLGVNTYYVEVEQTVPSCLSSRIPVTLTINPISSSSTNTTICASALPYTWNGLTFLTAGSQTKTLVSYLGCDSLATLNLTVTPNAMSTTNTTICQNSLPYSWNGLTFNVAGSQVATLGSSIGCDSLATLNLTVTPSITPVFTAIAPICYGATPPVLLNISTNGVTGTWSPAIVNNTLTGTYTFTPTSGQCAAVVQITVVVTVNHVPTQAEINIHSNSPICSGSTLNLFAEGGIDYEWMGPNGYAVVFQNPVRTNATIQMSGNYTVTVTNAVGCSSTSTINVLVNQLPIPTIGSNSPICAGNSLLLTSGGGTSYSWSGPNSFSSLSQNPTLPGATIAYSGVYYVTVTGTGGCTSIAQTNVLINSNPTVNPTSNSPICVGSTLNLSAGGVGNSYSWSGPNSFVSAVQNPTLTGITASSAGNYSVTITATGGCTASASTSVIIGAIPTPTISGDTSICLGETTTLTANGGTSYMWGSQAGATITVSPNITTTYQVIATNAQGCTQSASVIVNVSNLIVSSINSINDTCSRARGVITINVANGFGPYTYQWSNVGLNSPTNQNITEGTYMVTVTDNFGCEIMDTIVLSNIPLPILTLTNIIDDHCSLGLGSASINASGGTGAYSYIWNTIPAQNTSSASNLVAGSYIVYVNDGMCSDSAVVTIGNASGPIANANYHLSSDGNVSFVDQSTGASQWFWNFGNNQTSSQQNPSNNYQEPGNYNVILLVTDNFGCVDTTSLNIIVDGGMEIWIPDAFTPNGDGINDEFGPVANGFSKAGYEMIIYDRWGKQLFLTHDYYHRWDGTIDGEKLESTFVFVYVIYICNAQGKQFKYQGRITTLQ